ncbi:hypothetical protein, partial [Brevundimonas naejangsanensis]
MFMARNDRGPDRNEQGGAKPRRTVMGRLFYWGAVLAVWGLIFAVVFLAVFARDLPDTSSLYEVDRQP